MLQARLERGFAAAFGGLPTWIARAPGRVNLIGEHTDYNDGFAMPMAIGNATMVGFRPGGDTLSVAALDFDARDEFPAADVSRLPGSAWQNYVCGVVDQLAKAGVEVPGGQLAIAGDIARGTGLSSSASLEVALAGALLSAVGEAWDPVRIALLGQRAECDFVGVRCGNLDQIASAATQRGKALLIDCRTLDLKQIEMPDDVAVMIVQSGVVRGLLDGEYNSRPAECERAAIALGVTALRDADKHMLERSRPLLDPVAFRRARHVISENERTLRAADLLAADDLKGLGQSMRESHRSQADDFGITVPETDRLVDLLDAAIGGEGGARQTGGGFGGAVVGIMRRDRVGAVCELVRSAYRTPQNELPDISIETPGQGLSVAAVQ